MASNIFIRIILFASMFALTSGAKCNAQGKCKYGGICGPDNQCTCPMNCNSPMWNIDQDQLYCSPRKGQRPKIFWNICFVMAEACELQRDVPLIMFDFTKPRSKQCQAKNAQRWQLCSKPEDFMGPCGGTLDHSVNGGVCLKDKKTSNKRCECPTTRWGANCEQKVLVMEVDKQNTTNEDNCTGLIGVSIGASLIVGVLLGIFALIRIQKRKRNVCIEKHNTELLSDSKAVEFLNNRGDFDKRCDPEWSNGQCVVEITADFDHVTSNKSTISAASKDSPKRQRLSGMSGQLSGDSNNNHKSNYDIDSASDNQQDKLTEVIEIASKKVENTQDE